MKKIIAITTGLLVIMGTISISAANAGAARRHTIEGFVLGTGAVLLGTAIFKEINKKNTQDPGYVYTRRYPARYEDQNVHRYRRPMHRKRYVQRESGYWETERTWVEPVYEKKWNPGHYNRQGIWVSGRYEKFMIEQGYWSEKKVWVWQ